jgi:hypothetical protein
MGLSNYLPNSRINQPGVCTSSTRPASPYEGQVIYETDTNRVLVYDSAAWVMIADTDQPPGMQLIKTQTIGSAVSSVTVNDAFSSEYDNYKIIVNGGVASTALDLRFNFDGNTAGYYSGILYHPYGTAGPSNAQGLGDSNIAYWNRCGNASTSVLAMNIDVLDAFATKTSSFAAMFSNVNTGGSIGFVSGFHNSATSFTGFRIQTSTGNITGGTIRVYGYRN